MQPVILQPSCLQKRQFDVVLDIGEYLKHVWAASQVARGVMSKMIVSRGSYYYRELTYITPWICNYINYKMQDEIETSTVLPLNFGHW